jgi:hypothetical protein
MYCCCIRRCLHTCTRVKIGAPIFWEILSAPGKSLKVFSKYLVNYLRWESSRLSILRLFASGLVFELCEALAARFGADLKVNGFLDYPSGSMLWARSAALRPFFDARLVLEDFAADDVGRQIDGTMAHAVERLFFVAAEKAGFSWIKVAQPYLFERRDTIKQIHDPAELHKFVARQKKILPPQASATPNIHAVLQEYGAPQQINETI